MTKEKELKRSQKLFQLAMKTITEIEDYFEYRYESSHDKDFVISRINNFTTKIKGVISDE